MILARAAAWAAFATAGAELRPGPSIFVMPCVSSVTARGFFMIVTNTPGVSNVIMPMNGFTANPDKDAPLIAICIFVVPYLFDTFAIISASSENWSKAATFA